MFGKDQLAVEADVKHATAPLDQLSLFAVKTLDFVRQTGGSRLIVSNDTVFDGQTGHDHLEMGRSVDRTIAGRRAA